MKEKFIQDYKQQTDLINSILGLDLEMGIGIFMHQLIMVLT